ncbi:MAG: hypothetical protein KF678_02420 [Phycisphaeraceae bacterium]|nr:hypothetical protein [Phycisphaeraceae bacterium]
MPITPESARTAFENAAAAWNWPGITYPKHLFYVRPLEGYPQSSTALTSFACRLFGEFVRLLDVPPHQLFVTYKGADVAAHGQMNAALNTVLPLEAKERFGLDFGACSRASTEVPWSIDLAMESETWPVKGKGRDPEVLFPDLVKLVHLRATHSVYFARINGGRETINGNKRPKSARFLPVLEGVMKYWAQLSGVAVTDTLTAIIVHTNSAGPWTYTIHTISGQNAGSYAVQTTQVNEPAAGGAPVI